MGLDWRKTPVVLRISYTACLSPALAWGAAWRGYPMWELALKRVCLCLAGLLLPFAATAQPASHLLSGDTLTRLSPHVWMIKGSPNIGIVVGKNATLVVDDGLGKKNGQMIA